MKEITVQYNLLIKDLFENRIKLNEGSKKIVFFQGFPSLFYEELRKLEFCYFADVKKDDGYIDYKEINSSLLLTSLLNTKEEVCWGYYEELLGLSEILNDFSVFQGQLIIVKNNLFSNYYPIPVPIDLQQAFKIFNDETHRYINDPITKYYSDLNIIDGQGFFAYVNKHFAVDINVDIIEIDFFINYGEADAVHTEHSYDIQMNDLQLLKAEMLGGNLKTGTYVLKSMDNHLEEEFGLLNGFGNDLGIYFKLINISREINLQKENKYINVLKEYWGQTAEFRTGKFYKNPPIDIDIVDISQGIIVNDIIDQCEAAYKGNSYSDIIITAPTGAGKSLFFQIAGIYLHKQYKALTIVICPLIALMNDQVKELEEDRGVDFATYINSELTFEQRYERIEGIKKGKYSIVYLSPELLLSGDISNIIGDRKVGLMVIDEAHLVTSWGRDFRVDYWFLGDYLEKVRRGSYFSSKKDLSMFPVLCLTATAVLGGRDDIIEDLQRSMHLDCSSEHLYIGYVCRDNIRFLINNPKERRSNYKKEEKNLYTIDRIGEFLKHNEKSIIYFPYVSQIDELFTLLKADHPEWMARIEKYSGSGMSSLEKNDSYTKFRNSQSLIMLATKAFGMGVNITDIRNVYHFAPTGTLADYIQEIGRAARKLDYGYAIVDYLHNDMRYAKTLWGLSGLRHYQIKSIMKKLYDLYTVKKSRNLLISPEVFSYLFDSQGIETKVKSGLMLLSTDLLNTYHFKVITVRPKNLFSIHYINVPEDVEEELIGQFGRYCVEMNDDRPRTTMAHGNQSEVITYNNGKVFEINLAEVWENEFSNITFALFKRKFFNGDLFTFGENKISPRLRLVIHYSKGYNQVKAFADPIFAALQRTFNSIHHKHGGREFAFEEFYSCFNSNYRQKIKREYILILLDLFCFNHVDIYDIPAEQWKFIEKRTDLSENEFSKVKYKIITRKHNFIERNLQRYLRQAAPNTEEGKEFVAYLPIPKEKEKYSEYQLLASLLEMFDLATYELTGGRNPQIFVRLNDPLKLKRVSESPREYRNSQLTDIEERHRRSAIIVDKFMTTEMGDNKRWEIIQNYFLGFDGLVDAMLGIEE